MNNQKDLEQLIITKNNIILSINYKKNEIKMLENKLVNIENIENQIKNKGEKYQ